MFSAVQRSLSGTCLLSLSNIKLLVRKDFPPDPTSRDCFHLQAGRRKNEEVHGKQGVFVFVFLSMSDAVLSLRSHKNFPSFSRGTGNADCLFCTQEHVVLMSISFQTEGLPFITSC